MFLKNSVHSVLRTENASQQKSEKKDIWQSLKDDLSNKVSSYLQKIITENWKSTAVPGFEKTCANLEKGGHIEQSHLVIGDLHGSLEGCLTDLWLAGFIDEKGHWKGDQKRVVIMGDVTDRGSEGISTYLYIDRLQSEARAANGEVIRLLGNHELFILKTFTASLEMNYSRSSINRVGDSNSENIPPVMPLAPVHCINKHSECFNSSNNTSTATSTTTTVPIPTLRPGTTADQAPRIINTDWLNWFLDSSGGTSTLNELRFTSGLVEILRMEAKRGRTNNQTSGPSNKGAALPHTLLKLLILNPDFKSLINMIVTDILSDKVVAAYQLGGRIFTHAGISTQLQLPNQCKGDTRLLCHHLNQRLKSAVKKTIQNAIHKISIPQNPYTDEIFGINGIFWSRLSFAPAYHQIIGHQVMPDGILHHISSTAKNSSYSVVFTDIGHIEYYGGHRGYLLIPATTLTNNYPLQAFRGYKQF